MTAAGDDDVGQIGRVIEKTHTAVRRLTGLGDLPTRVEKAAREILHIQDTQVPDGMREAFIELRDVCIRPDVKVPAMDEADLVWLSGQIVSFALLAERFAP